MCTRNVSRAWIASQELVPGTGGCVETAETVDERSAVIGAGGAVCLGGVHSTVLLQTDGRPQCSAALDVFRYTEKAHRSQQK